MTYQQAMSFALSQINQRIEEVGAIARQAKEDGDDETNTAARNFQNGFIECADLLEKMTLLVQMSGGKPSRTCAEAKDELSHPLARPWPETIAQLFDGRQSLKAEEVIARFKSMGVTEAQMDGTIELLHAQPGITTDDELGIHWNDEMTCQHASISDRGFLYPNYACQSCGKQFGEDHPGNRQSGGTAAPRLRFQIRLSRRLSTHALLTVGG